MQIEILNNNHFCLYKNREVGIAQGCFAGQMFAATSDNKYITEIMGESFGWVIIMETNIGIRRET